MRVLDPEAGPLRHSRLSYLRADLAGDPGGWRGAFEGVDAVVHLAAQNPYPEATWDDAAASIRITAAVFQAAAVRAPLRSRRRRRAGAAGSARASPSGTCAGC